ncbi:MAG: cation diffusion facilitator family transporter [Pseudomonadales bacterium]|jgi:cation diffusion facilitator family transporter|nr:cation diffusion facilitator family transporter [Pseudomonadales bacterium]
MKKSHQRLAMRVARNTILINILLSAFKLFAGIVANSTAMISDAVHSVADSISTVIVIISIKISNKKPDKKHPQGHKHFEPVATLILAIFIFIVGVGIGWHGIERIISKDHSELIAPGILALVAAAISIAVKEGMYWYVRATAKKVNSSAMMADAWHSRADGLSSIGSFIGILGARLGFPILDYMAAIVICLFIVKISFNIGWEAIKKLK